MDEITKHHFTNIATGKAKKHKDGSLSTVYTLQVDLPDKTGKRVPTLIPSVYDGEIVGRKEAEDRAVDSGKNWPTAETHTELREFDKKIHKRMNDRTTPTEAAAELIRAADKQTVNMNEGGMTLKKQMELFDDGGLMDEGGTTDPVSGNDVPPGSTQEEVRDDIPAQLSEGEFVFPADVVRYIGLETLMRMRQEAKMGLAQMEAMGQMGNSEEATMPDDLPFDMYDLELEDDGLEMQTGGMVPPAPMSTAMGATTTGGSYNPATNQFQPFAGMGSTQPQPVGTAFAAPTAASTAYNPRLGGTLFTPTTPEVQYQQPTLYGTTGFGPEGVEFEDVTYVNEQGQILNFKRNKQTGQLFNLSGNPTVVPEGYTEQVKEEEELQTTVPETKVQTAKVVDNTGREGDPPSTQTQIGWGGKPDPNRPGLKDPDSITMVDFSVIDVPGMLPGLPGALAGSAQTLMGKDYPDNAKLGISIDGVTTVVSGADYNAAKTGVNEVAYTGPAAEEILDRAQTNAATVNAAISRYDISKNPYGNETFDNFMEAAAKSDVGIAELAAEYGIDIDDIKDNPFGLGKNYNDAIAKAVEKANEDWQPTYVDRFGVTQVSDDKFTKEEIKAGHKARIETKARADALKAKAEKAKADAAAKGVTDYGGAGTPMGIDPGPGGNIGDAAAAVATGVGTGPGGANEYEQGDAGYD